MKTTRVRTLLIVCGLLSVGGCERIESLLPWQSEKPAEKPGAVETPPAAERAQPESGPSTNRLRREIRALDSERERARAERERLSSELERMRSELERSEDKTERLQGEIDRLESGL